MKRFYRLIMVLLLVAPSARAGSANTEEAKFEAQQIADFAKQVENYMAEQGAYVAILSRMGRPAKDMPKGIRYTHTAIAVYSNIQLADGETVQGYAIHNLYQLPEQTDKSHLVVDYPVDFFWGAQELEAGIIIPTMEMQKSIIEVIQSGGNAKLHNPNYSVIANPFNSKRQNCTEHTLDIINSAIYDTDDVARLKANAKAYFKPQRVRMSPLKVMMGSMLMKDVTTKDHDGKIYTTTFGSIANYMAEYGLSTKAFRFVAEQGEQPLT